MEACNWSGYRGSYRSSGTHLYHPNGGASLADEKGCSFLVRLIRNCLVGKTPTNQPNRFVHVAPAFSSVGWNVDLQSLHEAESFDGLVIQYEAHL